MYRWTVKGGKEEERLQISPEWELGHVPVLTANEWPGYVLTCLTVGWRDVVGWGCFLQR